MGGLGRAIAHWMVAHGARYLIFMSRNAGRSIEILTFLQDLTQKGCQIKFLRCDICDQTAVTQELKSIKSDGFPAIRGVIQAAMVLQVGLVPLEMLKTLV
jgi:NAD(P)-dependent dehydrogenase (short-subunit alcohol dehydrogenase family)